MKRFIILLILALVSMSATGCYYVVDINPYTPEQEENQNASYKNNTKTSESGSYAYVRLGMYETVEGCNVTITGLWLEKVIEYAVMPEFGTNITETGLLSTSADEPVFDKRYGDYNKVPVCKAGSAIVLHINAKVVNESGFTIDIKDAKYVIPASETAWKKGTQTILVNISKDVLRLSEITFNPVVDDYETENVTITIGA